MVKTLPYILYKEPKSRAAKVLMLFLKNPVHSTSPPPPPPTIIMTFAYKHTYIPLEFTEFLKLLDVYGIYLMHILHFIMINLDKIILILHAS